METQKCEAPQSEVRNEWGFPIQDEVGLVAVARKLTEQLHDDPQIMAELRGKRVE